MSAPANNQAARPLVARSRTIPAALHAVALARLRETNPDTQRPFTCAEVATWLGEHHKLPVSRQAVQRLRATTEKHTVAPGSSSAARARLTGYFAEVTEFLSWSDSSSDDPKCPRAEAVDALVSVQGSWATADQVLNLGRALLRMAGEFFGHEDLYHSSQALKGEHGVNEAVCTYFAEMLARAGELGAEGVNLALALGEDIPCSNPGFKRLDVDLHPDARARKGGAK